jgi:hypothetical protein
MNDRYAAYDLDSFGNGGYQGASPAACIQQPQQRYVPNNGPCMDDYDPTRLLDPINMATYNPTGGRTGLNGTSANHQTHHTRMPSNVAGVPSAPSPAAGMQSQGLLDFEPIPLSTKVLRRLNPHQPVAHSNSKAVPRAGLARELASSPLSDLFPSSIASNAQYINPDAWLHGIKLTVSGVSLEPLSGTEVVKRLETRTGEVVTRYLPCVDFLVQCQQELRKGLAAASTKRLVHNMFRDSMTPRQFYNQYISNLPERFYRKNQRKMKPENLSAAVKELQKLCADARAVESQGCEVVKNTFLGGMKDGESWGLRKWLSKHGGALHICTECECVLHSCQKLDRSIDSTRKLSEKLRPLAKKALLRLKSDVPSSYQEQSSAHPYLPFFHRLESALRGMSTFDPEDDDVICIDDDEVEEIKAKVAAAPKTSNKSRKRKAPSRSSKSAKHPAQSFFKKSTGDSDSEIEILDVKPAAGSRRGNNSSNSKDDDAEYMKALLKTFDDDPSSDFFDDLSQNGNFSPPRSPEGDTIDALDLAAGLDRLAGMFDQRQDMHIRPFSVCKASFWDDSDKYACALRLFSEILRTPDSALFLERVDEEGLIRMGNTPYSRVVKHPLCFRDIVTALLEETDEMDKHVRGSDSNGVLAAESLSSWNMWRGNDLLQAIDLVFLNALAYGKADDEGRSNARSTTNKLRKLFWAGVKRVIDTHIGSMDSEQRRRCTPTRRGETSGFVVHKDR